MVDLATVMRDQARAGLQTLLDTAVTNGDTEAARKAAKDLAALEVSAAPKAPPFGDAEIRAQLDKQEWFGTDPKRSAKAVEFGKTMNPSKFATAEAFAAAVVKAVEEEFKPPADPDPKGDDDPDPKDDDDDPKGDDDGKPPPKKKTDAPGDDGGSGRSTSKGKSGPWTKISDAPPDVQKEVKRAADRFVSATAPKEQREKFIAKALESHYAAHQRKGKK